MSIGKKFTLKEAHEIMDFCEQEGIDYQIWDANAILNGSDEIEIEFPNEGDLCVVTEHLKNNH